MASIVDLPARIGFPPPILPFVGRDFAMLFLLHASSGDGSVASLPPDTNDGLADLERRLWMASMSERDVSVALPKFEIDIGALALRGALVPMGIKAAFDRDAADFTGIANPATPADRLFIGDVFHRVFVHVDEDGTEAAAAPASVGAAWRRLPRGRWSSTPTTRSCSSATRGAG